MSDEIFTHEEIAEWESFNTWCVDRGIWPLPADVNEVKRYLAEIDSKTVGQEAVQQAHDAIVKFHRECGHDFVATGNPGCMMFLGAGAERAGIDTGVVHPVELIDAAEGNATGHAAYREGPGRTTSRTETERTA